MGNIIDYSGNLRIFTEGIVIDKKLPKWQLIEKFKKENKNFSAEMLSQHIDENSNSKLTLTYDFQKNSVMTLSEYIDLDSPEFNNFVLTSQSQNNTLSDNGFPFDSEVPKKQNKLQKIFGKLFGKNSEQQNYEISVVDFFRTIKEEQLEDNRSIEIYKDYVQRCVKALERANNLGQVALADKIKNEIFHIKYESIMLANGFSKRLTEEQLVKFVKKTERGLKLDYIKNFTRVIPEFVYNQKLKADKMLVFDNYVILHFDPENKNSDLTEKEKELERKKKADPILFGVLKDSKNLYYIADWIDEYCDLTLSKVIETCEFDTTELNLDTDIQF